TICLRRTPQRIRITVRLNRRRKLTADESRFHPDRLSAPDSIDLFSPASGTRDCLAAYAAHCSVHPTLKISIRLFQHLLCVPLVPRATCALGHTFHPLHSTRQETASRCNASYNQGSRVSGSDDGTHS